MIKQNSNLKLTILYNSDQLGQGPQSRGSAKVNFIPLFYFLLVPNEFKSTDMVQAGTKLERSPMSNCFKYHLQPSKDS